MNQYTIVVQPPPQATILVQQPPQAAITTAATQGPPGPPGPPGSGGPQTVVLQAAIALGGHRIVCVDSAGQAIYPDRSNPAHADAVVGITTGAASAGADVTVQTTGEMIESSWSWSPGPIWVGDNGLLTQTSPTSGWVQMIAIALSATKIVVTPRQATLPS
jgi:hypothetical protein